MKTLKVTTWNVQNYPLLAASPLRLAALVFVSSAETWFAIVRTTRSGDRVRESARLALRTAEG